MFSNVPNKMALKKEKYRILVLGCFPGDKSTIGTIAASIFSQSVFDGCSLTFCYFEEGSIGSGKGDSFLPLSDPYFGGKHLLIRFLRKTRHILGFETGFESFSWVSKEVNKKAKNISFDSVLCCAGIFSFFQAGYRFAKSRNLPLFLLYFDPFSNKPGIKDISKRKKIEDRWLSYASWIFYDFDGEAPSFPEYRNKMSSFYIPIGEPISEIPSPKKQFVYGGLFYQGIRDPFGIFSLAERPDMKDYSFLIFSNLALDTPHPKNVYLNQRIPKKSFENVLLHSEGSLLVGNTISIRSQPSKFFSDIALRRPIIAINPGQAIEELSRYPFAFDSQDPDLRHKIESITSDSLLSFDVYKVYPERRPFDVALSIYERILPFLAK